MYTLTLNLFCLLQYKRNKDAQLRLSIPEVKLIIVFVYYTLLGVVGVTHFSMAVVNRGIESPSVQEYFRCESLGLPNNCDRLIKVQSLFMIVTGYVLVSLMNSVHLIYVINCRKANLLILHRFRSFRRRNKDQHSSTNEIVKVLHNSKFALAVTSPMLTSISHSTAHHQ